VGLDPVQRGLLTRDVVAAGTPVLAVHGIVDNRSIVAAPRRASRTGSGAGSGRAAS
jgi:hypothetical protein